MRQPPPDSARSPVTKSLSNKRVGNRLSEPNLIGAGFFLRANILSDNSGNAPPAGRTDTFKMSFRLSVSRQRRLEMFFPPLSCRCQATEVGRREGRTVGSDQEAEESAGGGEAEALQGGQLLHRRGGDGERYRPAPHRDAE